MKTKTTKTVVEVPKVKTTYDTVDEKGNFVRSDKLEGKLVIEAISDKRVGKDAIIEIIHSDGRLRAWF